MKDKERLISDLIREGHLKTPRIIEAFRAIDRMDFVPYEFQHEAYGNYPLSIGFGQTVSQPLTVAIMLELLDPEPGDKILDVGFGSGWTAALLAHLVGGKGLVIAIERIQEIFQFGKDNIAKYSFGERVKLICGDGTQAIEDAPFDPATKISTAASVSVQAGGELLHNIANDISPADSWQHEKRSKFGAGFDKILAGASALDDIPEEWRKEIKVGGRIVAPVGESVVVFNKKSSTEWDEIQYPGFSFVPLIREESRINTSTTLRTGNQESSTKKKKTNRYFNKFFLASCFLLLVSFVYANEIYRPHAAFSGSKSVEIPRGSGSRQIAKILKNEGVIRSKWTFLTYVAVILRSSDLKPGDYVFDQESIPKIIQKLLVGGTDEQVLVIPEGWNIRDIGIYLEGLGMFQQEEFLELVGFPNVDYSKTRDVPKPKDFSWRFGFLTDKSSRVGLEGYLFPDTYRVFKDATVENIILKMLENFEKRLTPDLREAIERQKKTIFEIVTMASLIEKEVILDEDRAMVSGILWKRLEAGFPLQVDATIIYITGKKSAKVSKEDTEVDSLFNTYKYRGFPLGPISNPGLSAIRAAIYPKVSPFWFYLSTPDGKTIFSKNIEEHNEAKAKYLR